MLRHYTPTTATIDREILFPLSEEEKPKIPEYFVRNTQFPKDFVRNTGASLELHFEEAIEPEITLEFADAQRQRRDFPTYSEEDILNWDFAIEVPSPPSIAYNTS